MALQPQLRISNGALLVVLALLAPLIVELRTVLAWINVELTVLESVGVAIVLILAVLVWALWPQAETDESAESTTR